MDWSFQIGVCVLSATTQSNQIHVLHEINFNNPNQTKPNWSKTICVVRDSNSRASTVCYLAALLPTKPSCCATKILWHKYIVWFPKRQGTFPIKQQSAVVTGITLWSLKSPQQPPICPCRVTYFLPTFFFASWLGLLSNQASRMDIYILIGNLRNHLCQPI
jgi:hypothetical protein